MDIEQLNKSQTILLTLLVSFVTSIATGIVTVTLMDQAPPAITQTIHKVIEKTVETVVPKGQTASVSEVVVVREENVIADVVKKNEEAVARIYQDDIFVGFGIFVDKKGILITDKENLLDDSNYSVVINGEVFDLNVIGVGSGEKIAYLEIIDNDEGIFKTIFDEVDIVSADSLKLGQSVVVLGGIESTEVLTGIVSGLIRDSIVSEDLENPENVATSTENKIVEEVTQKEIFVSGIKTNIPATSIISGAPLLNLKGEVVGININPTDNSFIPIDFVKKELKEILALKTE